MRAIDADELKEQIKNGLGIKSFENLLPAEKYIVEKIDRMPTIQLEPNYEEYEWCTDCKEYDHENRCCPRWTRVIRQTRRELQDEFVMTAVDGTLWVTVDDVQKVGRVIVDEEKSKFCRQFYMEEGQRTGKRILDRSGAYCCSECLEPCAGYVMMKPRDKFCKMCGAKMELA